MAKRDEKPPSKEDELQRRVDAMMDPNHPDPVKSADQKGSGPPPLDIFAGKPAVDAAETKSIPAKPAAKSADTTSAKSTKTAPELSGDLLTEVDVKVVEPTKKAKTSKKKEKKAP